LAVFIYAKLKCSKQIEAMRKYFVFVILFFALTLPLVAQNSNAGWEKWQYLLGEWKGEGSGQPGTGSGMFTIKPKLEANILERKGRTAIAATATQSASVHEDVTIIYKNREGIPDKAIYFDNEKHVINYSITYPDSKIVMTSEAMPGAPRFRLIYDKVDEKQVKIRFEIAMPNAPEEFKMYLEGSNRKVRELSEMPK
jgi:hypothetical protein